jgi:two-component system, sporulation sensor kinase D
MQLQLNRQLWKVLLLLIAIAIGLMSLVYTNRLVKQISDEERKKVELWAEATRQLATAELDDDKLGFFVDVIKNNSTVPVILTDKNENILTSRNLDSLKSLDTSYLREQLRIMKMQHKSIVIEFGKDDRNYIYYRDSTVLTRLSYYPYVQIIVVAIFLLVAYLAFSSSRKAEQNKVWVGLSKETAHQMGTPTSSLMAWVEIMRERNIEPAILAELERDVKRLAMVSERFSKIGSNPELMPCDINEVISTGLLYLRSRLPERVKITLHETKEPLIVPLAPALFGWVIENLCKNAADAMEGQGSIDIYLKEQKGKVLIDVKDSGRGMINSMKKTIFNPGYTTKLRGWGLGLSLAKRIIETYHKGQIFVLDTELNKGTTFRILLRKQS